MQIVCPHCDTAYDVRDEALKPAGRTVRCARCKETWLAVPIAEPAVATAGGHDGIPAGADDQGFPSAEPGFDGSENPAAEPVHIDSPPLAADLPATEDPGRLDPLNSPGDSGPAPAIDVVADSIEPIAAPLRPKRSRKSRMRFGPATILAALGAVCAAIVIWRADIVRLMPQTAPFFKTLGLTVNLRALDFAAVRTTTETVDGTTILVIEGEIVARKPVEIPRLRFGLRDAAGKEIHAWNATIEQASLGAGERAAFASRLAAPPADGREITVRFFNKRDIASGGK